MSIGGWNYFSPFHLLDGLPQRRTKPAGKIITPAAGGLAAGLDGVAVGAADVLDGVEGARDLNWVDGVSGNGNVYDCH